MTRIDETPIGNRSREELLDELLVTRCLLGEAGAFDGLIERWHGPLWKYVRRVSPSEDAASDSVQEVWLRVVRSLNRLREPQKFRSWLFGIARRIVMDRFRREYAHPIDDSVDLDAIVAEEEGAIEDQLSLMHEELSQMPVVEREILVLFYLNELSLSELSEVLGIPVGTVKSRLHRARQLMRAKLTNKGVMR